MWRLLVSSTFATASLISVVLVAPLAFLELRNNSPTLARAAEYVALFGLLWLLPMVFVMTASPLVRALRSGHTVLQSPIVLGVRFTLLCLLAVIWLSIVSDQLPCFMGIPNRD